MKNHNVDNIFYNKLTIFLIEIKNRLSFGAKIGICIFVVLSQFTSCLNIDSIPNKLRKWAVLAYTADNFNPPPIFTATVGNEVLLEADDFFYKNIISFKPKITWDFGDHVVGPAIGRSVVHTYMRPGTYTINVTASIAGVCINKAKGTITVTGNYPKLAPRPDVDPILEYKFEDNLNDTSGHGLNALWGGNTGVFSGGMEGQALKIGGGTYIHAGDDGHVIGGSSALTVSFWARKNDRTSEGYLINYPGVFYILLEYDGTWSYVRARIYTNTGYQDIQTQYLDSGEYATRWHHYILLYDGANVRFYFDGREAVWDRCPRPLTGNVSTSGNHLYLGTDSSATTYFNGTVDELKIYSSVLSEQDMFQCFESLHAEFHARIGQYIYVRIPGDITKNTTNILRVTLQGDNGYSSTLVNDRNTLQSEEKYLLRNSDLPGGNYTLTTQLRNSSGIVLDEIVETFSKPYDGIPMVGIDENNAIRVNGQLYFPVTPWMLYKIQLDIWKHGGWINTAYSWGGGEFPASYSERIEFWSSYLDYAKNLDLMAIGPNIFDKNMDTPLSYVADFVSYNASNPAQLLWFWWDEPDLGGPDSMHNAFLPVGARAWTRVTHENDPQHPVLSNIVGYFITRGYDAQSLHSREYQYMTNANRFGKKTFVFDVYQMDYYPIEFSGTISRLAEILDIMDERSHGLVPMMGNIETTDQDYRPDTPWHPSPEQLKMMIWVSVIHGIKGLEWFHYFTTTPPANFDVMKEFLTQIEDLKPAVLSAAVDKDVNVVVTPSGRVDTMIREYGGKTYLFAVRISEMQHYANASGFVDPIDNYDVNVTFTIEGLTTQVASVYGGTDHYNLSGGSFSDIFAPFDVHIYVIE